MRSILYNISCSMEKLGKPFHRSALLCGVALFLITSYTSPSAQGEVHIVQIPLAEGEFAPFTLVTCVQETPFSLPTVSLIDPATPAVEEECASDGNSSCATCISAILIGLDAKADVLGYTVTHQMYPTKPRGKRGTLHHFTIDAKSTLAPESGGCIIIDGRLFCE